MVSVTFVVSAILRCSTGSQSSGLLVSLLDKKQIKEVVHLFKIFSILTFLEGKTCVPAKTTLSLLIYPYVALLKLHLHAQGSPLRSF